MEIVRDYFIDLYPSCLDRHVLEGWQIAGRNCALECERISTPSRWIFTQAEGKLTSDSS